MSMKSNLLLIIATFCCVILFSNDASSQEKMGSTFELNQPEGAYAVSLTKYQAAIESGDFNCFRFKTKRRTIVFESGVILTLYSAAEILKDGALPPNNCFLDDNPELKPMTFQLHESGIVTVTVSTESKTSK